MSETYCMPQVAEILDMALAKVRIADVCPPRRINCPSTRPRSHSPPSRLHSAPSSLCGFRERDRSLPAAAPQNLTLYPACCIQPVGGVVTRAALGRPHRDNNRMHPTYTVPPRGHLPITPELGCRANPPFFTKNTLQRRITGRYCISISAIVLLN